MSAPGALGLATCRASADSAGDSAGCNTPKPCTEPTHVGVLTTDTASQTGQMLLDAVATSLNDAYPDRPEPFTADTYTYRRPVHISWTPPELLSALHGYRYQSSEAGNWPTSEAAAFVDALQLRLIRRIPGYSAGPWCVGPESQPAAVKARTRA